MATVPVTFSYRSSSANSIQVAGDWDSWAARVDLTKVPNQQEEGQDLWQATHQLKPSTKFQYKFIQNGDDWHTRDDLPVETDASGNKNNVLTSPEPQHAASVDESKDKTPAELIGAGVTSAVGAAIAGVVGVNPLETDKQPIASTPGLTAGSDESKQLNAAEKQSALESSAQGAPAGAAIAGANGVVLPEQLSKLSLSDGKNPADGGAAAIASAAAASTAAIPAGSSTGTSAISPKNIDTVKDSSSTPAQQQGTLDQSGAMKGLGAGAAGDAPTVGSTKDGKATNASPLDGVAAGAAGIGAALAGGAATAAAVLSEKGKEATAAVQEKVNDSTNTKTSDSTTIDGQPSSGPTAAKDASKSGTAGTISGTPASSEKESVLSKPAAIATTAAAATATAAGGMGAAVLGNKNDKVSPNVGGNPSSEVDAGIKAANNSVNSNKANDKDLKAAAAGGTAATTAAAGTSAKDQSETIVKQEKISSGPAATSTQSATTNPQHQSQNDSTAAKSVTAAAAAAAAGAGAGVAATHNNNKAKPSETVAKQEQISSGPTAASTQNTTTSPPAQSEPSAAGKGVTAAAATAAAGAGVAGATSATEKKKPSETVAKQEQLSSGPAATAAGAQQSETVAKQEQLSSGPVTAPTGDSGAAPALTQEQAKTAPAHQSVAPVAAPTANLDESRRGDVTPPRRSVPGHYESVEYSGQETPKTVPNTPNTKSATVGAKQGGSSKYGTRRKSRDIFRFGNNNATASEDGGEVSENGETFKTAPSSVGNTPERKTLERSRKKSFFGKLKEKLSSK